MKKHNLKKIVITLIILLLIGSGLGYWFGINTSGLSNKINVDNFHNSWMNNLKDDVRLQDVVIPGSHDAGTYGMMPQARTQGHEIIDQLNGGVRYFDIRVTSKGDDLVIFHGPIKGQKFSKVINQFNDFVNVNKSEFIIIDFQHLGDDVHDAVINMINKTISKNKILDPFFHPNISEVTFDTIRTQKVNFMIVWKSDNEVEEKEAEKNGFYTRKNSLRSEYNGKIHKKSDEALINEFDNYYKNYEKDKLFVLQAQRTAKTLLGRPSMYEKSFNDDANEYIINIENDIDKLKKTNIIMRDFIVSDPKKVDIILNLNISKNNIKEDKIEYFKSNCN